MTTETMLFAEEVIAALRKEGCEVSGPSQCDIEPRYCSIYLGCTYEEVIILPASYRPFKPATLSYIYADESLVNVVEDLQELPAT